MAQSKEDIAKVREDVKKQLIDKERKEQDDKEIAGDTDDGTVDTTVNFL